MPSEVKRLKQLEEEDRRLKQMMVAACKKTGPSVVKGAAAAKTRKK